VVQFLKLGGAGKIIVVELSETKRELARQAGADVVLDARVILNRLRRRYTRIPMDRGRHCF